MHRRAFVVFLVFAVASSQFAVRTASISFGTPASGQNYEVNAPIAYSGSGSWQVAQNGQNGEPRTAGVQINLMWFDPANPGNPGTIVGSDTPEFTYLYDQNDNFTGNYTFANSTNDEGDSNLIAKQYQNNTQNYAIQAKPINIHGQPYIVDGAALIAYCKLGTIS
jgi:hypothetical protein